MAAASSNDVCPFMTGRIDAKEFFESHDLFFLGTSLVLMTDEVLGLGVSKQCRLLPFASSNLAT